MEEGEVVCHLGTQSIESIEGNAGTSRHVIEHPGPIRLGKAESGGRITSQIDQSDGRLGGASQQHSEAGSYDRGAAASLDRPAGDEHEFPPVAAGSRSEPDEAGQITGEGSGRRYPDAIAADKTGCGFFARFLVGSVSTDRALEMNSRCSH